MTAPLACGVDVGGTKIAGGVVDHGGRILEEVRVESPAEDVEAIQEAIAAIVTDLASRHDIACVGIGAAAYVDRNRAKVMFAPNLAWRDLDLKAALEARVQLPVVVENDANAAAWGEFTFGAGKDVDDLLLVTVGTGVGGGIVLGGNLHHGAFGVAAITGPLITEAARAGDTFALGLLANLGTVLGEGIASLAAVLAPAVIAIGGGVSEAGDLLIEPIRAAFGEHLTGRGPG